MLPPNSRFLKVAIYSGLAFIVFFAIAATLLPRYLTNKIESHIKSAGGKINNLHVSLLTRSVLGENFEIEYSNESVAAAIPHRLSIEKISLKGISLFDLVASKKLKVREILIDSGHVNYNTKIRFRDLQKSGKKSFSELQFDNLIIKNLKARIVTDSFTEQSGLINLKVSGIKLQDTLKNTNDFITFKNLEGDISDLKFYDRDGLYLTKISRARANMKNRKLSLDSITLLPLHSKFKFAKMARKQIDRVNVFILKIDITGLNFYELMVGKFLAAKIDIQAGEVYAFRDKRMPFKEKKNKPLPMAALRRLKMDVEIDSVRLQNSRVTYEEFPEEGFKSAQVIFEDLQATIANVSNRRYYNKSKYAKLTASSKLLGKGLIQATFLLPIQEKLPYHATGRISGMHLHHLNPILENLAFMHIESGKLNELKFNFNYDDRYSSGAVTINYQDLKIKGLKKEKNKVISDLKSFLINTVVRNDKDKTMPVENRTGTITFERDRKRQIFNFWWKSLFSGIKNSVLNAKRRELAK